MSEALIKKLLHGNILIEIHPDENVTKSGIHIPKDKEDYYRVGTVLSVEKEYVDVFGKNRNHEVSEGDKILFDKFGVTQEITPNVLVIKDKAPWAILEES